MRLKWVETICSGCDKPIEEYPDAISGGWTHTDLDYELTADHAAFPKPVEESDDE